MNQSVAAKLLSWFAALLAGVGLVFLALAVRRNTLPYNSEGNYFDGVVNYHEQSVAVYGVIAGAFLLAAVMLFGLRLLVQRTRQGIQVGSE